MVLTCSGYLYSDTLTGDQVTYQLCTTHAVMLDLCSVHSANVHTCSVTIYVHSVIIPAVYTVSLCIYSHYNAAIYSTDTVSHCIVTMYSPYKVPLCSVNTVSLILLNYTVSLYSIHMQCQYTVYTLSL